MLKSSPVTKHIPVIILTAMNNPEDKLRGFGLGADDYITKPYHMPELLARVAALLHRAYEPHHR
jgi:DNA-binding response OmpR family regulator